MEIQTLKFRVNPPGAEPLRSKLECERARDLENAKGEDLPFACLVERKDLAALRQFKDLVVDRGSKNKHKGLSEYLLGLGPDKIPIIDGNYGSSRQLGRSIQAFLSRAFAKGESNLYIIGTEKTIFNELWKKAGEAKGEKGLRGRPRTEWRYSYQPQSTDISSWLLHELRAKCEPPPELSERYVGESEDAFLVRQLVILAAHSEDPVLVLGDTGTGKEVVAREIHRNSRRKGAKFITVNCSGIPRDLLESELFGHVKGAFTDAKLDKAGLWEIASGGTLFLDEIGDLHLENQAKILRALEEESIRRIGATEDIPVNARVIAATNRDLFSMVQTGEFREDLYYRLRGFLIRTLALRDHPEDIPLLAQFFWEKIARDDTKTLPQEISDELQSYSWPGNARELKMILNNLRALFGTDNLRVEHLRAVFHLEGQSPVTRKGLTSEKEITLHRAECLRHLKRVHEVVHASQFTILPVMEDQKTDPKTISSVQASLRLRFHELEMLCRHPLLFHSEHTFSAVYGLKGKITYLLGLLQKDVKEAKNYWDMEVAEAFGRVMSTIFKEIENVLGKA